MNIEPPESEDDLTEKKTETRQDPYILASAMLTQDKGFILKFLPFLALPDLVALSMSLSPGALIGLEVLKRGLQITFLYFVISRWRSLLSAQDSSGPEPRLQTLLLAGFLMWLLFAVPSTLMLQTSTELTSLFAVLLIPACLIWLRYFFYFVPLGLGAKNSWLALKDAKELTDLDWTSPLKALVTPVSATALLVALAATVAPDGSLPETDYLTALSLLCFPILATYLGVSFGISLLSNRLWHNYQLDPYRESRLSTVTLHHEKWLANALKPKNGILLLFLATLIGSGNTLRAATTPPSATLEIVEMQASKRILQMKIRARDEHKFFRGFRPSYFRLAGEKGGEISVPPHPVKVWVNGDELEFLSNLPGTAEPLELQLEFKTDRQAEDLVKLTDLYLWYRNVPLQPLDGKAITVKESF